MIEIGAAMSNIKGQESIAKVSPSEMAANRVKWYNESAGKLNETDGYDCPECKNKGDFWRIDESGSEVRVACKCQKVRATLRRAQRSGLGNIITQCTFAKFDDSEPWQKVIKEKAMAFCADDESRWFYIGGQVGCGKTFICTAISAHYIKAGREVKYMLWSEDAKKLKSLANDISYQDHIEPYKTVDVLYIDDFLKVKQGENPTTADMNLAFEIINHRLLDNKKVTIISSEKLLDELLDYDEATMSRIYEKAGDYKINIRRDKSRNYRLRGTTV